MAKESNWTSPQQQQVSALLRLAGHAHFGFAKLSRPLTFDFYEQWLRDGYHGDMAYLQEHAPLKETPQNLWPQAKSAIVIAFPYLPHPRPLAAQKEQGKSPTQELSEAKTNLRNFPKALRIALYAQGEDYHSWLKAELEQLSAKLQLIYPKEKFFAATDSSPVLERDLARRAGLGWVGKNTCLIDQQRGSHFFIGEILTSLDFYASHDQSTQWHPDRCGTCKRCIDACPTKAIELPRKLNAQKCISYLTIESRSVPSLELRTQMGDHFFGCDICQNVCPWNEKIHGHLATAPVLEEAKPDLVQELRFILQSSSKALARHFYSTALMRARGFGLKRNALIVTANRRLTELKPEVSSYLAHPRLGELAQWAMERLSD